MCINLLVIAKCTILNGKRFFSECLNDKSTYFQVSIVHYLKVPHLLQCVGLYSVFDV